MFTRMVILSRSSVLSATFRLSNFASSTSVEPKHISVENDPEEVHKTNEKSYDLRRSGLVAAAFASLNNKVMWKDIQTPYTDNRITQATNINELLSISDGSGISRKHALKVVSVLAEWSSSGKIKLPEFEQDPRFVRLCRILTSKSSNIQKSVRTVESKSEDLSTVLSVTADDEAAKLVENITLPQMVKVMSTLAQKKRRSTLLLRTLAFNIARSPQTLNIKQCGDLLYGISMLNFIDENLLMKISNDICSDLSKKIDKSSVIGSIVTSIGFLKYKNIELLDSLSEWFADNSSICRPQDIFGLLMTLAVVNYKPANFEKLFNVLLPQLTPSEAGKPSVWLDVVWSLVLLKKASAESVSSILEGDYVDKLEDKTSISSKLKLLNIDAAAQYLIKDYKGPRIPETSSMRSTKVVYSKEKYEMVDSVVSSLKNLIQSETKLQTGVNTGMGFSADAVCLLDHKCNPLPLDTAKPPEGSSRVAILTYSYHDMCRGEVEPTGINELAKILLEAQGYKVLPITYTDFKPKDKLIQRVQCLEQKLKEIVKS